MNPSRSSHGRARARWLANVVAGAFTLLSVSSAHAQADEQAKAKTLFERGLADMIAGRYETGCPAIEESYKLDPRPGTLFTSAECEAKRGRIATGVELYDAYLAEYARLSPDKQRQQGERMRIAREQRTALARNVPEITLLLVPEAPPSTVVTLDGREIAPAALGLGLPCDPGERLIVVTEPGRPPLEVRIDVAVGETKLVTLPRPAARSAFTPKLVAGIAAGGLGVVGLAVGVGAGMATLAKKSVVRAHCDIPTDPYGCDATGLAASSAGKSLATVSTASFVVAGVALAAGVVLMIAGDPKLTVRPTTGATSGPSFSIERMALVF
jgi:hypothetical protein